MGSFGSNQWWGSAWQGWCFGGQEGGDEGLDFGGDTVFEEDAGPGGGEAEAARARMLGMIARLRGTDVPPWKEEKGVILDDGAFQRAMRMVPAEEALRCFGLRSMGRWSGFMQSGPGRVRGVCGRGWG